MEKPKHPAEVAVSEAFASVPVVGKVAKALWDNANDWRRYRGEQTAAEIAEIVGVEQLYERARENPELAALLVHVIEMAERTGFEAKRRLLVMAAAKAFEDDDAIDPAVLTARALAQLEPVHIKALVRIARLSDSLGPQPEDPPGLYTVIDGGDLSEPEPDHTRNEAMLKAGQQIPLPVLVALVNAGVVIQATMVLGGGTHLHDISPFGRQLLRELQHADPDDEVFKWTPPT